MKRFLAVILVSVMMCWTMFAEAASLSIFPEPLGGSLGDTLLSSVVYTSQGAQIAGLQFEVLFNPSALSLSDAQAGTAAILSSKDLVFFTPPLGNTNFIIFGFNQNVIGDGSVADLTFQVNSQAPTGPYNLSLSGILGSDANGNPVTITNLSPAPNGAVPIPSTLLPLGIGLVGLAAWRSWHRKAGTA